jgi:hypothetical protein
VIPAAQGSYLAAGTVKFSRNHRQVPFQQAGSGIGHDPGRSRAAMMLESERNGAAQSRENPTELSGIEFGQAGARHLHAATDIHPDRVGNDHPDGGQNAANGHAIADVGISHNGDMVKGAGQISQISGLVQGLLVEMVQPKEDRDFL